VERMVELGVEAVALSTGSQRALRPITVYCASYSGLIEPMACHRPQNSVCLDSQEERHEHVVAHDAQGAAWEELVRPALFLVLQDVQAEAVVVPQRHTVLLGNLFCYGYSHG
jgi:hypothetical protein